MSNSVKKALAWTLVGSVALVTAFLVLVLVPIGLYRDGGWWGVSLWLGIGVGIPLLITGLSWALDTLHF